MAELEFYYTPPGGSEVTLVKMPDVTGTYYLFKGMQGFGMPTLEPAVAERGDDHGGVYVGSQPRAPERVMTLSLGVIAATYSAFWTKQAALSALVTPFVGQQELGKLRIVKPNSTTRYIDCLLIDDPMDSGQKDSLTSAIRHLQFWAPYPMFYGSLTSAPFSSDILTVSAGVVAPVVSPIVCGLGQIAWSILVAYTGTARAWPQLLLYGPARYPHFWRLDLAQGERKTVVLPLILYTGDQLLFDMQTGVSTITRANGSVETINRLRIGSERWQLEPGNNEIYLAAPDLVYSTNHRLRYYPRYVQL